jgi:hypothetical protein
MHEWVGALSVRPAAKQRKTAQTLAAFFEQQVRPHAEWEERFLCPAVDKLDKTISNEQFERDRGPGAGARE